MEQTFQISTERNCPSDEESVITHLGNLISVGKNAKHLNTNYYRHRKRLISGDNKELVIYS